MKPLKYHVITFGCQMNVSDSERMSGVFDKLGLALVDSEKEADVVVINACSVRQKAIDRIWGKLKEFNKIKSARPDRPLFTVLTGCVLPADRPKFSQRFDLYFPMKELPGLPDKLAELLKAKSQKNPEQKKTKAATPTIDELLADRQISYHDNSTAVADVDSALPDKYSDSSPTAAPLNPISQAPGAVEHYLQIQPKYSHQFSAFVPIMTGCNAFCTYCAVPFTRGREVSRKPEEVIDEVEKLLAQGYKEITLLGQIINKYMVQIDDVFLKYLDWKLSSHGANISEVPELQETMLRDKKLFKFHHLLAVLASLKPQQPTNHVSNKITETPNRRLSAPSRRESASDWWLRFTSSHPKWFSRELIDTIKRYNNIACHIHLPVQAGSNSVLKRMLRPYQIEEYKNIISYIRENIPGAAITTDCIVGFCGETDEEFNESKELFRWARYDMAFISQYSPRPGTKAQINLTDDVLPAVKKQRENELNKILAQTALENNQKYLDKSIKVLVMEVNGQIFGRTETSKKIRLIKESSNAEMADTELAGQFVMAQVTSVTPWSLEGKLVE